VRARPDPPARLEVAPPPSGLPDPLVLSAGGRAFAVLGERCGTLATELRRGGQALSLGRGGWTGAAAEEARRRAERLAAALDLAATAASDAAAVLVGLAAAVTDALAAREAAERLAAAAGWQLTPDALAGGGDPVTAARVAGLTRQAAERSAAALAAAAAGFAEVTGRARAACALVEREGEWAGAIERRLHGPVPLWADFREGLADGARDLVVGAAQAAALGSPLYWTLRPRQAWRQGRQALAGGLAALQHPGRAAAAALGAEDLGNGHAARFWGRLAPQVALAAAARGAAVAREAALPREAAAVGQAAKPLLADVNPGYPGPGRLTNCAHCALATDATLAGRPACALPGGATSIRVLEAHYGRPFVYRSSAARIVSALERAGPGARGIVFASRGTRRPGHLFNVANLDGDVRFLDGQRGGPAAVEGEGYVAFFLLRTD
jgi:Papain fold toxin 1, glutamine deamidase